MKSRKPTVFVRHADGECWQMSLHALDASGLTAGNAGFGLHRFDWKGQDICGGTGREHAMHVAARSLTALRAQFEAGQTGKPPSPLTP